MYIINDRLATDGIGEDVYPTPDNQLQTFKKINDWTILDVRCLNDEGLNTLDDYQERIDVGCNMMEFHPDMKLVVCCGAGHSRSNAIALGILVKQGMDFWDAWELIKEKVPVSQIDPSHISALKKLFNVTLP